MNHPISALVPMAGRLAMVVVCSLVGSTALAEAPTSPPPGAATEQAQMAEAVGHQNEMVCTVESKIGSNIKKKTCKTRAQIDAEHAAAQQLMKGYRKKPVQPTQDE